MYLSKVEVISMESGNTFNSFIAKLQPSTMQILALLQYRTIVKKG